MNTRKYPLQDIKILYSLAAGRCAFPNCKREVVLDASPEEERQQIGIIAHIVAHNDDGPRGDASYPREKLDTYENWIMLCPTCHAIIDAEEYNYPPFKLRQMKDDHETWVRSLLASEISDVGFPELEIISRAVSSAAGSPSENFSVTPPAEKMARNGLTRQTHILLTMGLCVSKEVHDFLQHMSILDIQFPERLKAGFITEYIRLRANGIYGDSLFENLRQFACGGSRDFKRQAAGLAVLSYLFECCEVFEQ